MYIYYIYYSKYVYVYIYICKCIVCYSYYVYPLYTCIYLILYIYVCLNMFQGNIKTSKSPYHFMVVVAQYLVITKSIWITD